MKLNSGLVKVAVSLIAVSFLMLLGFIGIPFLPLSAQWKAMIAGALFLTSEIFFWIGALIIGKDAAKMIWPKIVERVGSWFKKIKSYHRGGVK